jgi:serine/threonine-protein kinase RsbW
MIDSMSAADVANAERFERNGIAANAQTAGRTREEFAQWLADFFTLDPIQASDLILATNEALANAAEFAYHAADHPGTMDVQAVYHKADAKLAVSVTDNGTWKVPDAHPPTRSRGRGIPLMRALTDHATITTAPGGTRVHLEWSGISRRPDPALPD